MALKKKPVTGMKDILPKESRIRDYVIALAKETYGSFGFSSIETPCVEHIENLCSKQGGENEKLIFKILKRGEKLSLEGVENENDLADSGLRYDLTLPLSRYYSNNAASLPSPFKALQMGNVFRADRPQKGRFRQFMQCDIDILGDASYMAEVELITATSTLLGKVGFKDFKVRINDRRFLKAMAAYCGFDEEQYDLAFIILDKMDKIGPDGVKAELVSAGFGEEAAAKYLDLFEKTSSDVEGIEYLKGVLGDNLEAGAADNLQTIIRLAGQTKSVPFEIAFDPTLVRGMSYYTGTIFEIEMAEFGSSVAGGGRYDEMIGRFTGTPTPAVGFSIGFERIITILLDKDYEVPGTTDNIVFLLEKGLPENRVADAMKEAAQLRADGTRVLVVQANKNKKFQKEQLMAAGYTNFKDFYKEELKK